MGEPPAVEITITNMNDNVDENFLRNLLTKCGPTEEQIIYRHPRTQRRLGIARIVFVDVKSARTCIEKYNQQSVMGNVMNVFHDAFGEQCKQILSEASGEKKQPKPTMQPQPPPQIPPVNQPIPSMSTFKQKDEMVPHLNESDQYYQMDYNNIYARGGNVSSDHKPEESDWSNSREKYDDYGYEADDHRHYRYDKKSDSRRWDSKPSRYYKSEKDRDKRSDRRDYRSHRDERDRDSSRRRDYDYERKDRDRRERDHRGRDSKYRDYKKSDRDYVPPAENSFTYGSSSSTSYVTASHHHSSHHHYSSFDSTSSATFHQYPPPLP